MLRLLRHAAFALALVLLTFACARPEAGDPAMDRDAESASDDRSGAEDDASVDRGAPDAGAPAVADFCADGDFALHVFAEVDPAWNGRLAVVTAVERSTTPGGRPLASRVALLGQVIAAGNLSVSCPAALRENLLEPSIVAFVDVDGSGGCSDDDVGQLRRQSSWTQAVEVDLGDEAFGVWARIGDGQLGGPLHRDGEFCAHFEPTAD